MILVHWNPENIDYPLFLNLGSIGITVYDTMTVPCSVLYLVPVIYMELLEVLKNCHFIHIMKISLTYLN